MGDVRRLDHKIWGIAWPAILANVSIPTLGLVDAAILGHLDSTRYLGAVAIGSAILSFLYWGFSFLRMGTTGLVARAGGAGEPGEALRILARSAALGVGIAALILLSHPLWLALGLSLMQPDPALAAPAASYIRLRLLSAPAVLATYAVVGWCIGRQDTRWPMAILLVTNGSNIVLDVLFILGLGLASDGAALATACAEYLGLAVAVVAVRRARVRLPPGALRRALADRHGYRQLWRANTHLFLRTACLLACFAFFTAAGEKLGEDVLAGNALMLQFLLFAAFSLDGFAYAAEGLAGERLGARDIDGFRTVVRRCAWWSAGSAMLISALIYAGRPLIFPLLSDLAGVQAVLAAHSGWLVALPLLAAPSYLLDGVFIGAAETRPMMTTMWFSALGIYLPVWWLAQPLGNDGLWLAFSLFNLARGVLLGWVFLRYSRRGRWLAA